MNQRREDQPLSTADIAAGRQTAGSTMPPASEREQAHANGTVVEPPRPTSATQTPTSTPPRGAAAPGGERTTPPTAATGEDAATPLVPASQAEDYRTRWGSIQTGFVDEPRKAVEQADGLVAEVIQRVADVFAEERSKLEAQWSRGDEADTEDLRMALRRYRSFFERLLSA